MISPPSSPGAPVFERTHAFRRYFTRKGYRCEINEWPSSSFEFFCMITRIYKNKYRFIFITMPPFRGWWLFFLPGIRIIIDFRDGWSIAMRSGYGGTSRPKVFAAVLARAIEQFAVWRSTLLIVCTPGLQRYHTTKVSRNKIAFIPNGYSQSDADFIINSSPVRPLDNQNTRQRIFVCAGKFTEYGKKNVQDILDIIEKRYANYFCKIYIYSRSPKIEIENLRDLNIAKNLSIEVMGFIDRMDLLLKIKGADYGIVIIRDANYEFGTKIFDYILCGTPIVSSGAWGEVNSYFRFAFDTDYDPIQLKVDNFSRDLAIERCARLEYLLSRFDD